MMIQMTKLTHSNQRVPLLTFGGQLLQFTQRDKYGTLRRLNSGLLVELLSLNVSL